MQCGAARLRLIPMATHRQSFRRKREVVSLLRRAGYGQSRSGGWLQEEEASLRMLMEISDLRDPGEVAVRSPPEAIPSSCSCLGSHRPW